MNKIKSFKQADEEYKNGVWTETESALLYYRYFGEDRLTEDLRESIESNPENKKGFTQLVKQIRGAKK